MTKRFQCTACGKCCYGQLPLTWKDAFHNVERFPLCIVWTPVPQNSKDFKLTAELGAVIKLPDRKEIAVQITPTSFIPSTFPCPELREDNLCGIHSDKPARCKAMPFYPYRDEKFQAELIVIRPDWKCDTSETAPIVYQDKKIIDREDFDRERIDLVDQVPLLRRYVEYMLKYSHVLLNNLMVASMKTNGAQVITSLSSFLTATRNPDAKEIAQKQVLVLTKYIEKTGSDPKLSDFHKNYVNWQKEMMYLAR